MKKKLASLVLSTLLIGAIIAPTISNSLNNTSGNPYKIMIIWPDPSNG